MKKKYDYDFGFLRRWMDENRKRQKDILGYVDIKSYEMTRRWVEGEVAMGIDNILKFCNATGVSPTRFFTEDGHELLPEGMTVGAAAVTDDLPPSALRYELMKQKLDHELELNALHARYQEREDRIRADYDQKMQALIARIPEAKRNDVWEPAQRDLRASDDDGEYANT